jgi:hypothetical protein
MSVFIPVSYLEAARPCGKVTAVGGSDVASEGCLARCKCQQRNFSANFPATAISGLRFAASYSKWRQLTGELAKHTSDWQRLRLLLYIDLQSPVRSWTRDSSVVVT